MTNIRIRAGIAALALFSFAPWAWAANSPQAHVLLLERRAVMTQSKLGQNISQQIMGYEQKLQTELGPEGEKLQSESQAAGAKKSPALQAKEAAFRQKVQDRQSLIQGGEMAARKFYMAQLSAVVHAIMAERGAEVVLEKTSVVDSINGIDITRDVISRLDKKSVSYKVPLVKAPLADMLQMQGGMQPMVQQQ